MGEALAILANPRWVKQLSVVEMLRRVIGNIEWDEVGYSGPDSYALLYETFLAEYDPALRRQSGTYYTPDPVARAMVRFADLVLKKRVKRLRGFADSKVMVVDPAMGTGTFLVEIMDSVVATIQEERGSEATPKTHLRELFAKRLVGFELQVAPYAVAELRLHHTLRRKYGVELPREEVRFLSNALDDPDTLALDFGQLYEVLKEAREGANRIKRNVPVMVIIGNPPWREKARGEAPWIEAPRDLRKPVNLQQRPSLDEFRARAQARSAFNLSNMWTFFWRWATWKAFEANPEKHAGIVVLISPKAYVVSDTFEGMRRYLRQTADEGWIIDLTPEDFQPDVPTRPFPGVQQPICIGVFARYGPPKSDQNAKVHYTAVMGTREEKFAELLTIGPDGDRWRTTPDVPGAAFLPADPGWTSYPRLADLFPWRRTGVNANRSWVWAPDPGTLRRRWSVLMRATRERKAELFHETVTLSIDSEVPALPPLRGMQPPLSEETLTEPPIVPVAFRSFDRQYLIYDRRVIDRARPELWQLAGDEQVYISEQHAHPFKDGPGLTFTALVPNVHHFNNRGGRVRPLYLSPQGTPNIAEHLLAALEDVLDVAVGAPDLLAYVAALVAHPYYTRRFSEDLQTPGVRIPITASVDLWREAVGIGREVLWIHTYGMRYYDESAGRARLCPLLPRSRRPRAKRAVPCSEAAMPTYMRYQERTHELTIGSDDSTEDPGVIENVDPAVWEYTVGGMPIVKTWFGYRRRHPTHKKISSDLDTIRATCWTEEFDDQLFELLNVLGRCIDLEPRQANLVDRICDGPLVSVSDLERRGAVLHGATAPRIPRQLRYEDAASAVDSSDELAFPAPSD
jgi:hypothetical protein